MSDVNYLYVVYQPYSNVHNSAHVDGVYDDPEGASAAAHRLMLANHPEEYDRVIIQRVVVRDSKEAMSSLKGRQKVHKEFINRS
jgi:hypothetical protein